MTVFHLLRHGHHGLLGRVLAGRMEGVGLSERGRAEIAAVAERLANEKIAALYASPLQRTRESAEIVAARLGLPITFHDELIDRTRDEVANEIAINLQEIKGKMLEIVEGTKASAKVIQGNLAAGSSQSAGKARGFLDVGELSRPVRKSWSTISSRRFF